MMAVFNKLLLIKKFRVIFSFSSLSVPSNISIQILIIFKFNGKMKFLAAVDNDCLLQKKNFAKKKSNNYFRIIFNFGRYGCKFVINE